MNTTAFVNFYETLLVPVYRNFTFAINDEKNIVIGQKAQRVSFHVSSHSDTHVGQYKNQYAFALTTTKDGKKLDQVIKFVNSLYLSISQPSISMLRVLLQMVIPDGCHIVNGGTGVLYGRSRAGQDSNEQGTMAMLWVWEYHIQLIHNSCSTLESPVLSFYLHLCEISWWAHFNPQYTYPK